MFALYPHEVRNHAIGLMLSGRSDGEIASALQIPRTTIRDWRRSRGRTGSLAGCPRCWERSRPMRFEPSDYAELLGLYLGDGHILSVGRSLRLRLSLDARYPEIVEDTRRLLARTFPANRVGEVRRDGGSTRILSVNHRHLACLFPQHGPGKKHTRLIDLEAWQQVAVACAPWHFLRGCIRSDGCAFLNRTGRYSYLSFDFSNHSSDILDLFQGTCDSVGVECRRYDRHIRIYRRASVAALVEHVGLKA